MPDTMSERQNSAVHVEISADELENGALFSNVNRAASRTKATLPSSTNCRLRNTLASVPVLQSSRAVLFTESSRCSNRLCSVKKEQTPRTAPRRCFYKALPTTSSLFQCLQKKVEQQK